MWNFTHTVLILEQSAVSMVQSSCHIECDNLKKTLKSAAIFENGRFRRPYWNFEILNILISFRMPKNIWIDTKMVQIGHFYIFYSFSHGRRRPSWILGFWRKSSKVPVRHSSDLDSAPQNLLETAKKITRYKKTRFSAISLGLYCPSLFGYWYLHYYSLYYTTVHF